MRTYPNVTATLTAADREAPFIMVDGDDEGLPPITRLGTILDGGAWVEIDMLGRMLAAGQLPSIEKEKVV